MKFLDSKKQGVPERNGSADVDSIEYAILIDHAIHALGAEQSPSKLALRQALERAKLALDSTPKK